MDIKKFDLWLVNLGNGRGSEQNGIRPCLVVQNNIGNTKAPVTIVCPVTTKLTGYNTTHVYVECLKEPSNIMLEQIRVIDKSRLIFKITELPTELHEKTNQILRLTLGM